MADFRTLEEIEPGQAYCPYAARTVDGVWQPGLISIAALQERFGQYDTASEMKAATDSEGLKLYFDWLADQGKIPR